MIDLRRCQPHSHFGGWQASTSRLAALLIRRAAACSLPALLSFAVCLPPALAQQDNQTQPAAPPPTHHHHTHRTFTASISGTVLETSGAPVREAEVSIAGKDPLLHRTMAVDANGAFQFTGLPGETYTVTVRAAGIEPVAPVSVPLGDSEAYRLPITANPIPKFTATVTVKATPVQIATAQVHEQMQQRVLGIVPNFFTSYLWNAAPMTTKLKYHLVFRTLIDPISIAGAAAVAGAEQWKNIYPGYGSGGTGYLKRFGASYADSVDARLLGEATLPALFHQDPRYFYRGSGSVGKRIGYSLAQSILCRGDNGHQQFAYSRILGDFGAAGISNLYHAPGDRGLGITFRDTGIILGADAAEDLLLEFISRPLTSHVPSFAKGKKSH